MFKDSLSVRIYIYVHIKKYTGWDNIKLMLDYLYTDAFFWKSVLELVLRMRAGGKEQITVLI